MKKIHLVLLICLGITGLLVAGCSTPTPETVIVKETVIVNQEATVVVPEEKIVEVTRVVEEKVEVVVTATPEPEQTEPVRGGSLKTVVAREFELLNFYIQTSGEAENVESYIAEPLIGTDDQGQYFPQLVEEVPSVENGLVSEDGLTVIYKLKSGILWSDGEPLTSEDIKFTWEAIVDPDSGASTTTGYKDIESIETPDELTAILHFSKPHAAFLSLFPFIMPKHYCGEPADMFNWEYNQKPIGTGPFKMVEWVPGSHVVLERNDLYREEGKPYIDQMIFQFVPNTDTALIMLQSGEADIIYGATIDQVPALRLRDNIVIDAKPSRWVEGLWLNRSQPDDGIGDAEPPHPILGDVRVRQALAYAIDRQRIIDNLLYGLSQPGTSIITTGWARNNDLEPWPYDMDAAKQLLDEAGWTDEDGDGIREAHGAMYAEDGTKLSLRYQAATGVQLREQVQQLVVEDAAAVGIELRIDNAASTVVMGSWEAGGTRKTGNFDIIQYATGVRIDPQELMEGFYHSRNIPTAENNGGGYNYSRISDPELDKILEAAGATFDQEERAEYFRQAQEIVVESCVNIYLYDDLDVQVYNSKIQGWRHNIFLKQGWNSQDWWIKE